MIKEAKNILFPPVHREGYLFIALFVFITLILFYFSSFLGWIGVILSVWCYYFFRNPARVIPVHRDLILSPADGLIQSVAKAEWPAEATQRPKGLKGKVWRVSIFMNVFNVHVNRAPVKGEVQDVVYIPGKFLNASLDKASVDNERQLIVMETTNDQTIAFVQIAGLVARRITRYVKEGDHLDQGAPFGMIRFGSRVDVYFSAEINPLVCEGQLAIAGETILADFNNHRQKPKGVVR